MMILKVLGPEINISSTANNVANAVLVRIINTGAAAVANIAFANGTTYANLTVSNTQYVVIEKDSTDLVKGANMLVAPVAYRG
jgi:hypothetical protein